jgi:DNA processing protein
MGQNEFDHFNLSHSQRMDWLQLARSENVGPVTFYNLIERFGDAATALNKLPDLAARGGRKKPLQIAKRKQAEQDYNRLRDMGGGIILACEASYPLALSAIEDAPPVLSYIGHTNLLDQATVAIVGARNASLNGRKFAGKLAGELGGHNYIIASGMARGIDTGAHQGALETGTIAVLAGGLDVIYPKENEGVYNDIARRGLLVSEARLGEQPTARHFPRRNRIISGLAQAAVVVEASKRSGSLITARMAGEQGREVFAVPGFPGDPRAQGPNYLIQDGAYLIQSAEDIIDVLNSYAGYSAHETRHMGYSASPAAAPVDEDALERARETILENLSHTPVQIDELIRETGESTAVVQTALTELDLAGQIQRLPGNRVSLLEN